MQAGRATAASVGHHPRLRSHARACALQPTLGSQARPSLQFPGFPAILAQALGLSFLRRKKPLISVTFLLLVILACPSSKSAGTNDRKRSRSTSAGVRVANSVCEAKGNFGNARALQWEKNLGIPESALRVGRYLKSSGETLVAVV
jgi:hypothetical protein